MIRTPAHKSSTAGQVVNGTLAGPDRWAAADAIILPRSKYGERPTCEAVMPAAYFHRAYAARDAMHYDVKWSGDVHPVGHMDGGYCLDRPEPATGSHRARDYVYGEPA